MSAALHWRILTVGEFTFERFRRIKSINRFSKRFKTIYALSSGALPSAIAVVRISGDRSEEALRRLTRRANFEPMRMFYSKLFDEHGKVLDHAMACFMKAPKTFTGENCVELYLHGSRAVVNAVFATLARMPELESAKAGEFSKRAFYNNKMDVLQVEALAGLIGAETDSQRVLALRQANSSKYIRALRTRIVNLCADLEASIDFGEEMAAGATIDDAKLRDAADEIRRELATLRRSVARGTLIRNGVYVALVGRTNVGKSSIMNRFAEKDVAIVSNTPGTTRDSIQLRLELGGSVVHVTDTAGIRETPDELEREGIRRSIQRAEEANIIIVVLDEHNFVEARKEAEYLLKRINFNPDIQSLIVCVNKADIFVGSSFDVFENSQQIEDRDKQFFTCSTVWTSCRRETGLHDLVNELERVVRDRFAANNLLTQDGEAGNDLLLSGHRHARLLDRAHDEMQLFADALDKWNDSALAAFHLRNCAAAVGEIAGGIVNEEVMERIFSTMCVGK